MTGRILLFIMLIVGLNSCFQSKSPPKYKIHIHEWAMVVNNHYLLTNDSITAVFRVSSNLIKKFSKKLTAEENEVFMQKIKSINFDKFNNSYENNSVDDNYELDWHIKINNESYRIHIYNTEVKELLELKKLMNEILPDEFSISCVEQSFQK